MHQSQRQYSVEDYYFFDAMSQERHEYFDGAIYALMSGTLAHASILGDVLVAFCNAGHETFGSNMRLTTPSGLYTYPDVSVVHGEAEFIGEEERTTLLNPTVIVEVLSTATHVYDRGEKFENYRSIPSLREYLLIEQTRPSVELRERTSNIEWISSTFESLDQSVHLASINLDLPLARVYKRVKFPH